MKNRAVTVAALAKMGARAVPRLIEALQHTEARVRRQAVRTLGKCSRGQEAVPALLPLLRDPNPLVRDMVVETLDLLDPDDVVCPVVEASLAAQTPRPSAQARSGHSS